LALRLIAAGAAAVLLAACGTTLPTASSGGKVRVVAAENFWGSIAGQLGGDHAAVVSIVANPAADPHDYEPTPSDARAVATADYVIANGAGYDPWVQQLANANPVAGRKLLVVGELIGKRQGDNPHIWYSPPYVRLFVDQVARDLGALDPKYSSYFAAQAAQYLAGGLKPYFDTISSIQQKYKGTKVGASESIFSYLADDLDLDLVTPYGYLKAISEGSDPSAADKAEVERQISSKEIKVFVFNSQNSTPEVRGLVDMANAGGIPVVKITETLVPQNATFQDWQTAELHALLAALGG
jgi:zinc/manganese transport system substrate-binding protein